MRVIPPKAAYASNRYSLVKTKADPWLILNKQRKHHIDQKSLRLFLSTLVPELGLKDHSFAIVFIPDEIIRRYNRQYRGFDKPTDVLSFRGDRGYLGDILISTQTAYNQAQKSRTLGFDQNLRRLVLHGLLHLMGYDHETDDGQMRVVERRLRRRFQC